MRLWFLTDGVFTKRLGEYTWMRKGRPIWATRRNCGDWLNPRAFVQSGSRALRRLNCLCVFVYLCVFVHAFKRTQMYSGAPKCVFVCICVCIQTHSSVFNVSNACNCTLNAFDMHFKCIWMHLSAIRAIQVQTNAFKCIEIRANAFRCKQMHAYAI